MFGTRWNGRRRTIAGLGRRAFLGGARVVVEENVRLQYGWGKGQPLSAFIEEVGGSIVESLVLDHPTLVLGQGSDVVGQVVLHPTWHGWCAGVVRSADERLDDHGLRLPGSAAAALGVSEAFQFVTGPVGPGRRDVGVSLWVPGGDWRSLVLCGTNVALLTIKALAARARPPGSGIRLVCWVAQRWGKLCRRLGGLSRLRLGRGELATMPLVCCFARPMRDTKRRGSLRASLNALE